MSWIPPSYGEWFHLKRERDNLRTLMIPVAVGSFLLGAFLALVAVLFL